ncbi:hypothetical protein PYW07_013065 [Mythimna separata]|uniref:Uncharacterized protein n=1 Tax=Mythimna separata TaxID=271217 RepID=A0AAD7Y5L9_MYTSE|nr:hypothetical protein PYW07_013065 [Mythimna separata]
MVCGLRESDATRRLNPTCVRNHRNVFKTRYCTTRVRVKYEIYCSRRFASLDTASHPRAVGHIVSIDCLIRAPSLRNRVRVESVNLSHTRKTRHNSKTITARSHRTGWGFMN